MQETQEMWVQYLGWDDPLQEEMATYYSILAWRIPWTVEPEGSQSIGSHGVRQLKLLSMHMSVRGNPWTPQG